MYKYMLLIMVSCMLTLNGLPDGFVYLTDIEPTIVECMRYATVENFVGRPVQGYNASRAIVTKQAAEALKAVQKDLLQDGYCLVVYDAYRPQKAVDDFVAWGKEITDQKTKECYYPRVDKATIFKQGYIATKSGHSRGSTVDVTIIPIDKTMRSIPQIVKSVRIIDGCSMIFLDDNTLDMGSSFDLFDRVSHHDCPMIDKEYLQRRNYLRTIMQKHGFKGIHDEWWHYTLKADPFPDIYFDFNVE